jgi:hypothetical protein
MVASDPHTLSPYFSAPSRRVSYEFFTDRSGTPDEHFATLVFGFGSIRFIALLRIVRVRRKHHPSGYGDHRIYCDLFACLRLPSIRPSSMDEIYKTQDDNSPHDR